MEDVKISDIGLEKTLFQLLQGDAVKAMDTGSLLVLISLINLMGLIDIINLRVGLQGDMQNEENNLTLENAMNHEKNTGRSSLDPAALMGVINQFIKPQPRADEPGESNETPAET